MPNEPIGAAVDCGEYRQAARVGAQVAGLALSCSEETAMPTRRFERIALAQLLVIGCVLIEHAQAQPGYVPPPTPLPPPVLNPSSPNVVPQPSYRPITPTTPTPSIVPSDEVTSPTVPRREVTSPENEEPASTPTRSERRTRSVHHYHRGRYTGMGPSLGSFDCSYGWCVRISPPHAYYRPYGWYR